MKIVVQSAESGARLEAPGNSWTPKSTLQEVIQSLQPQVGKDLHNTSIRYVQKVVPFEQWQTTTLGSIGLNQGGRALLTLQFVKKKQPPSVQAADTSPATTSSTAHGSNTAASSMTSFSEDSLRSSIKTLLQNNFDVNTKECLKTLIKVMDNLLQQPDNEKVRSIRLANAAFQRKVVSRKGGGEQGMGRKERKFKRLKA